MKAMKFKKDVLSNLKNKQARKQKKNTPYEKTTKRFGYKAQRSRSTPMYRIMDLLEKELGLEFDEDYVITPESGKGGGLIDLLDASYEQRKAIMDILLAEDIDFEDTRDGIKFASKDKKAEDVNEDLEWVRTYIRTGNRDLEDSVMEDFDQALFRARDAGLIEMSDFKKIYKSLRKGEIALKDSINELSKMIEGK